MGKIINRRILSAAIIASLCGVANAEPDYLIRVAIKEKLSSWSSSSNEYSSWQDVESMFDCSLWEPSSLTVNLGVSFLQERSCSINQHRMRTEFKEDGFSSKIVETGQYDEFQMVVRKIEQNGTGEKDHILSTRKAEWKDWRNTENKSCDQPWTPSSENISEGKEFEQERTCEQEQIRNQEILDVWASGKTSLSSDTNTELQTVDILESRIGVGKETTRNMCIDILNRGDSTGDGVYSVDYDGPGGSQPKEAYCLMSQGGWTLYDSFGAYTGEAGKSVAAYNKAGINSLDAINSAGYSSYLTHINHNAYHVDGQYIQLMYGGDPYGYIKKNMPSWAKAVRADVSNQWRWGKSYVSLDETTKSLPAYKSHTSLSFDGTGLLKLKETSILWIDAVWVK